MRASLADTMGEYFHTFRNADLLVDGFQTTCCATGPTSSAPTTARSCSACSPSWSSSCSSRRSPASSSRCCCAALLSWCTDGSPGATRDQYDEPLAAARRARSPGCCPAHEAGFLERDALVRNLVERARRAPGARARLPRALPRACSPPATGACATSLDVPAWARAQGERPHRPGRRGRRVRLPHRRAGIATLLDARPTAPDDELLSPRSRSSRDPRRGHRPALPGREPRGPLRRLPLLPQGRDAGLPPEGGHGRPARRGQADDAARPAHGRRAHPQRGSRPSSATATTSSCSCASSATRPSASPSARPATSRRPTTSSRTSCTGSSSTRTSAAPPTSGRRWSTRTTCPRSAAGCTSSSPTRRCSSGWPRRSTCSCALGGVYIADTDLFQRDVTRFLNADIRPIYFVAKQLLRTLPVYFNEVGAEGELRAVSTQIDEICGRRDTLMHFLRKQVHAESSNRLVAVQPRGAALLAHARPSGLEPYLSANTLAAVRGERSGPRARTRCWPRSPRAAPDAPGGRRGLLERARSALAPGASSRRAWRLRTADGRAGRRRRRGRRRPAPRRPARAHPPAARPQVLALGRRRGRGRRPPPPARRPHAPRVRGARWRAGRRARGRRTRDRLLDAALTVLERAQGHRPRPAASAATENIYQKRHIAAGIPSIYGNYSEPQVRRPGALVPRREPRRRGCSTTSSRRASSPTSPATPCAAWRRAIRRFERALAVDGVDSRALDANLDMLEASFAQQQLHLPPVPERVPVPVQQRDRALDHLGPQPRAGAARRARQRPAPVRGARPVGGRGGRDGAARGARLGARHAGARPLRGGGAAPDLDAQRPARQPRPHAHDELRPRAPASRRSTSPSAAPTTR